MIDDRTLDAIEERLTAAELGDKLSTRGYPLTEYGCCLDCGSWTPAQHPEAHEHKEDCGAYNQELAYRKACRVLNDAAPVDIAILLAEVRRLRVELAAANAVADELINDKGRAP